MKKYILFYSLFLLFTSLISGCMQAPAQEISRTSNPSRDIDAVIGMKNTNATVATPMEVYLMPGGEKIGGEPVFRADHVDDIQVHWINSSVLEIEAKQARLFINLQNYIVEKPSKESQKIEIVLNIKKIID